MQVLDLDPDTAYTAYVTPVLVLTEREYTGATTVVKFKTLECGLQCEGTTYT